MRITCIGGGAAGVYFHILRKQADRADKASDLWRRKIEGENAGDAELVATVLEYVRGSRAMLEAVRSRKDCLTAAHKTLAHAIDLYCDMVV